MDRIFKFVVIVCVAFLAFVGGAFVILTQVFPYEYLHDAHEAVIALYKQKTEYQSPYQTNLWRPVRTDQRGVTINKQGKTYDGYTLYSSSHAEKAFLVSMDGKVVHEWALPLATIWDNPKRKIRPPGYIFWEYPHLYPNGDLLVLVVGMGDTPWGYGLVKMDKDSNVIWRYFDYTHHHLDVADDGRIYVLTNNIHNNVIKGYEYLEPPRIDDSVVVLSPDGKRIKKVSVIDALLRSPYGRMMRSISWDIEADFLHTNSVEVITREEAEKLPFAKAGQVLLSLRDIDTVAVLDLDTEEIVWAVQGSWHRQHDADMLPNGHIMLFDNWGHYTVGGGSRVIEFNPVSEEIVWSYAGDEKHYFASAIRSGQERLPNGNTLITESDGGRILEVTPSDEIVWEYINPVRGGEQKGLIPVLSQGVVRVAPESLDPNFLQSITKSAQRAAANDKRK